MVFIYIFLAGLLFMKDLVLSIQTDKELQLLFQRNKELTYCALDDLLFLHSYSRITSSYDPSRYITELLFIADNDKTGALCNS